MAVTSDLSGNSSGFQCTVTRQGSAGGREALAAPPESLEGLAVIAGAPTRRSTRAGSRARDRGGESRTVSGLVGLFSRGESTRVCLLFAGFARPRWGGEDVFFVIGGGGSERWGRADVKSGRSATLWTWRT